MSKGYDKLVECGISSWSADLLDLRLWIEGDGDTFTQLFFGEGNELFGMLAMLS